MRQLSQKRPLRLGPGIRRADAGGDPREKTVDQFRRGAVVHVPQAGNDGPRSSPCRKARCKPNKSSPGNGDRSARPE